MEVDCLVRCCVYLLFPSITQRQTETLKVPIRERQKTVIMRRNSRARGAAGRRRGRWEKWIFSVFQNVGKLRSIWRFHLCSERIISPQHPRGISQTAILQVRNPLRADKQDYEAPNPGKKLPAVQNHIQRMKMDCNTLKFISPGQERTCPLLFIGQAFYISSRNEYVLHHIIWSIWKWF